MHRVTIPQAVVDRVVGRQGRPLVHDDLPLRRTALVVIDLQNYFMAPGQQAEIPLARAIVPNVNRLATALRQAGGLVVWVRTVFTEETLTSWSHFHDVLNVPARKVRRSEALLDGAFGAQLWPELEIDETADEIIPKTRYSAFIQGASCLEARLRHRDIEGILIAGTMTNTCCETSARDAMMLNFRTTMITDANATLTDEEHNGTLINFYLNFGDIAGTDDILARVRL